jgi:plastocyanin
MYIMQKKYIIALIVVAVVVYIGFWSNKESAVAPADEQKTVAPVIVPSVAPVPAASVKKPATVVQSKTSTKTTSVSVAATPSMTKDGSYLVAYTANGFIPPVIEIKAGKSVHFVNDSNKAMSIASQEPNSQVYGELNQGQTVGRGGTYDFTFLQAGTWKYMNRNNSLDTGVIVVK